MINQICKTFTPPLSFLFAASLFFCASTLTAQDLDPPPDPPDVTVPGEPPPEPTGDPPDTDPGPTPELTTSELINVSTRGKVGTGAGEDFTVGFAIRQGSGVTIVAQAIGRGGLSAFLPSDVLLPNPQITVYQLEDASGPLSEPVIIGSNTDYADDPNIALLDGTSLDPETGSLPMGSDDATIVLENLGPGNYTLQITDEGGQEGVVIGSASFLNGSQFATLDTNLINVSTRGIVGSGTGEDFTVGFAVRGELPKLIVCQAVGAGGLGNFFPEGTNLLPDPQMTIYQLEDANGPLPAPVEIDSIDDYSSDPNLNLIEGTSFDPDTGSFPMGPKDASLVLELDPGNYTIQITDTSGASGIVIGGASELNL